jgi:hypothetical protein
MNVEIGTEAAQFPEKVCINEILVAVQAVSGSIQNPDYQKDVPSAGLVKNIPKPNSTHTICTSDDDSLLMCAPTRDAQLAQSGCL